jgi:hypothetical protein
MKRSSVVEITLISLMVIVVVISLVHFYFGII